MIFDDAKPANAGRKSTSRSQASPVVSSSSEASSAVTPQPEVSTESDAPILNSQEDDPVAEDTKRIAAEMAPSAAVEIVPVPDTESAPVEAVSSVDSSTSDVLRFVESAVPLAVALEAE